MMETINWVSYYGSPLLGKSCALNLRKLSNWAVKGLGKKKKKKKKKKRKKKKKKILMKCWVLRLHGFYLSLTIYDIRDALQ